MTKRQREREYVDVERRGDKSIELWRFSRSGECIHYTKLVRWFRWQNFWHKVSWSKTFPPRVPDDVVREAWGVLDRTLISANITPRVVGMPEKLSSAGQ